MSKPFYVIAECVDARSDKRYLPGSTFPDPDADQAERLIAAGCLATEKPDGFDALAAALAGDAAPASPAPPVKAIAPVDDLEAERNVARLKGIAKREQVALGTPPATKGDDIRALIRAARAAKSA